MLENYPLLQKSKVKAHNRRTKSGKIVRVKEHKDIRRDGSKKTTLRNLKKHTMWSESDYSHFKNKGYTNDEIKALWDRDHKSGGKPVTHKKAPDVVGVLSGKDKRNSKKSTSKENEGENMNKLDKYPHLEKAVDRSKGLKKSLEFSKTGKEVKDGIMVKIAQLEGELSALVTAWKAGKSVESVEGEDKRDTETSDTVTKPETEPWEIRHIRNKVKRLRAIHRNLKDNQKVKLSTYELEEYGL